MSKSYSYLVILGDSIDSSRLFDYDLGPNVKTIYQLGTVHPVLKFECTTTGCIVDVAKGDFHDVLNATVEYLTDYGAIVGDIGLALRPDQFYVYLEYASRITARTVIQRDDLPADLIQLMGNAGLGLRIGITAGPDWKPM